MAEVVIRNRKSLSKGQIALIERQALLDRRGRRNHKKRHSENKERSFREREKAKKVKAAQTEFLRVRRKVSAIMRAYFAGDEPDLRALRKYVK